MEKTNTSRIITIAEGLKELNHKVVYVGGAVVQFYADDNASIEPRATVDVDCVVKYSSHLEKAEFEKKLREHGFQEDIEDGVICRWIHHNEKVDIMPTDERFMSFSNKWYDYGYDKHKQFCIDNKYTINIMPVLVYVASKFEAVRSRGGDDLRCSHDFEDIIYVMNCCRSLITEFKNETNVNLKEYIKQQAIWLLTRNNIYEEIECVLPYGEEERVSLIINILEEIKA